MKQRSYGLGKLIYVRGDLSIDAWTVGVESIALVMSEICGVFPLSQAENGALGESLGRSGAMGYQKIDGIQVL